MKKYLLIFVLLLSVFLSGCLNGVPEAKSPSTGERDQAAVASLIEAFGGKLQAVSLQASKDVVKKSIQENYGDLVSPALLAQWVSNPSNAPGRVTSSPWPERIEIREQGSIIEPEKQANNQHAGWTARKLADFFLK